MRRLLLLLLGFLIASCGDSGGRDAGVLPSLPLGNDASLASLSISGAALNPAFSLSVTDYTAAVGFAAKSMQVTATPEDANATISVNGTAVASGVASDPIALDEGSNTITVNVTAEDGATTRSYTVVVTRQSASDFAQTAYVKASDPYINDAFGGRLALSADGATLAVGSPTSYHPIISRGCFDEPWLGRHQSIYEYNRLGDGTWAELPKIVEFEGSRPYFASDVELSADASTLAVSAENLGLYVYSRDSGDTWSQQQLDIPAPLYSFYNFRAVALSADGATLAVGVEYLDGQSGGPYDFYYAVYVFTRDSGGVWTQQAEITSDNPSSIEFGVAISLSGDGATLAVGEINAAYVFTRDSDDIWTERAFLQQFSNDSEDYYFGEAVALSRDGTTLAVGAPWWGDSGAVYVFVRDSGDIWSEQAFVKPFTRGGRDEFGLSVALSVDGSTMAIGAPYEDSAATGVNGDETDNSEGDTGAAYVFTRALSGIWTQRAYIKASNRAYLFGLDVALSDDGTTLAVGSPGEWGGASGVNGDHTSLGPCFSGAAYVFEL